MVKVALTFLSFIGLVALVIAGFALPALLIDDDDFEGEDRLRAEWALSSAKQEDFETPEGLIEALLTTAYRVERIGECGNVPPGETPEPPLGSPSDPALPEDELLDMIAEGHRSPGPGNFSYEVQRYTLFGIPYVVETEAEAELCDFTL